MIPKSFFCPCHEVAPVILGVLPEDFDHVQFRAVRRDEAEEGVVFLHPAQSDAVVEAVMDSSVIEDDEGWNVLTFGNLRNQIVHEFDEGFTVDRTDDLLKVETLASKVQRPHDSHPLMVCRLCRMRIAHRRPSALYGRRGTKSRLVVIKQLTPFFARPRLQTGKFCLAGGKSDGIPLFFRLIRVRLKLKPRAFSIFPSVSSVAGSAH